jgi:hypothetical protein
MADLRKQSGVRGPTQGQFTKPGISYPTPGVYTDYMVVERKTVDAKEQPAAYLASHPILTAAKLTKQSFDAEEDNKKTRTRIFRTLPGAKLKKYKFDETLAVAVEIETQDIAIGTAHPSAVDEPLLLDCVDAPTEMGWTSRTIVRLLALPATRTEYKSDQFTFPAILEDIDIDKYSVGNRGGYGNPSGTDFWNAKNTVVIINPTIRPSISVPTIHKVVTSWHSSQPAVDTVFTIAPNSCQFSGKMVSFNLGQVLMDELTFSIAADSLDPNYAGLTEAATIGASSPTATEWLGDPDAAPPVAPLQGTEQLISSDVQLYRGNIWIKRNIYITLK